MLTNPIIEKQVHNNNKQNLELKILVLVLYRHLYVPLSSSSKVELWLSQKAQFALLQA